MKTQWCAISLGLTVMVSGGVVEVGSDAELREAVMRLEVGTTLKIAPGDYRGGLAEDSRCAESSAVVGDG